MELKRNWTVYTPRVPPSFALVDHLAWFLDGGELRAGVDFEARTQSAARRSRGVPKELLELQNPSLLPAAAILPNPVHRHPKDTLS